MSNKVYGLLARFDTPAAIMSAAEKVRDAGYKKWDVITPFPIHGMDGAMGLRRSRVPRFTLVGGSLGFTIGMSMIFFMNKFDYPLIVGGKPFFSPMFAFPVSYELTILLAAFGTIIGMFLLNRLPMHYHPILKYDDIHKSSDDQFFLVIENSDPEFNKAETNKLLSDVGSLEIQELEE
ncbi:MAG: DUF3341 domain-containing protein [Opitutaceae bacterium]|nr:DUF3341 domain-containing protein [Opitutaceae bacterium]